MYDLSGAPEADVQSIYNNFRIPLEGIVRKLRSMASWPENWNGYGAAKPRISSVIGALRWISRMRADAARTGKRWTDPHVVPDENGDIAFEWWNGDRNLVVYVSSRAVEYLKVWGPDVDSQMEDGEARSSEENQALWLWLME
jgi:hypothetical protein